MDEDPSPLSWFNTIKRFFKKPKEYDVSLRDTLEELIEEHREDEPSLDNQEKKLLSNILDLNEQTAYDIMIPRVDIVGAPHDATLGELKELFATKKKFFIPIYRDTLDDIAGLLSIFDVVGAKDSFRLIPTLKPAYFVAPSMRLLDLLTEMHNHNHHIALVVDEYGGIDGLISQADVLDHILGDLETEEEPFILHAQDHWIVDGRLMLEDLEEKLGDVLTEEERQEDLDTVAGLMMTNFDKVPSKGDHMVHPSGFIFEVLDADPRRIKKVLIRKEFLTQE